MKMFTVKWKNKPKSLCYSRIKIGEYLNTGWGSTKNLSKAAVYFSERDMRGQLADEGIPVNKYFDIIELKVTEK